MLLSVVCCGALFFSGEVFATNLQYKLNYAWAWGGGVGSNPAGYEGIGWIDMSRVNIPETDGDLSGYAWAGDYGWISFNGGDLADCSPSLTQAKRVGSNITGGARILAIKNESAGNRGGFDGCISLSGSTYGLRLKTDASGFQTGATGSYAWSGDLGWIDFARVAFATTTPTDPTPPAPTTFRCLGSKTNATACPNADNDVILQALTANKARQLVSTCAVVDLATAPDPQKISLACTSTCNSGYKISTSGLSCVRDTSGGGR
jgi:hypothetical protein